jgi:hypothetical protein
MSPSLFHVVSPFAGSEEVEAFCAALTALQSKSQTWRKNGDVKIASQGHSEKWRKN